MKIESIGLTLMGLVTAGTIAANAFMGSTETMEYRTTVEPGDTVWSICSRIASNRDNMQELVRKTIEQNGIDDPAKLKPGTEIRVVVKALGE